MKANVVYRVLKSRMLEALHIYIYIYMCVCVRARVCVCYKILYIIIYYM